jgi:hypothetical protein
MAYADDVNLLGDNIDTIEKNAETLIDAIKEVGLEINVKETKYMLLSIQQNVDQNRDMIFCIIPLYLPSVQVHSVNWLKEVDECLGEGRSLALFCS